MSLMTLALMAVGSVLMGGSRIWQRLECGGSQEQMLLIGFQEMKRDLQSYHAFVPVPFDGQYERVTFPALVRAETEEESELREPGRLAYFFDKRKGLLCKSSTPYRTLRQTRPEDQCVVLAENVDKVSLKYYHYDAEQKSFGWSGTWRDQEPPLSVAVEVVYHDSCTLEKRKKGVEIAIPTGPIG